VGVSMSSSVVAAAAALPFADLDDEGVGLFLSVAVVGVEDLEEDVTAGGEREDEEPPFLSLMVAFAWWVEAVVGALRGLSCPSSPFSSGESWCLFALC